MISRLTGPPAVIPIKSFDDVIQHGYKVLFNQEGSSAALLRNSPLDSAARQIFNTSSTSDSGLLLDSGSLEAAMAVMLKHPNYLFFAEDSQTITRKDVLSLDIEEGKTVNYAIGLQPNSEFTDLFNHHLLKMDEAGVIQRMREFIQFEHYYLSMIFHFMSIFDRLLV